jgi:NhaA family Na+:H+ antiporter
VNEHHARPAAVASAALLTEKIRKPLERFFAIEAASGIVLLAATLLALLWANSPWGDLYAQLWDLPVRFGLGDQGWELTLHFVVNDGLMTVFFLLVGLEIRRELHDGALADIRRAVVPFAAALGGVAIPALIYIALATDGALRRGWAIPTATDIAFAIGVLAVLGKGVPSNVRVLLLALAVIDDVVAILVIAFFYSAGIQLAGLLTVGFGVVAILAFQRLDVRSAFAYILPGAIVWMGMLRAGVHPTLTGVILGLLTPTVIPTTRERLVAAAGRALDELRERLGQDRHHARELAEPVKRLRHAERELLPPVTRVELALHPWVAYGIMPLFALANAGVRLDGVSFADSGTTMLVVAVICGLVVGKPLGIFAFTYLVTKLRLAALPPDVTWRGVLLVGCLGGIGFTMSIFIANLAFDDASLLAGAKLAVLLGSVIAGVGGWLLGRYLLLGSSR